MGVCVYGGGCLHVYADTCRYALKLLKFSAKTALSFPFSFHLFQDCCLPQPTLLGKIMFVQMLFFSKKNIFKVRIACRRISIT